MLDHPPSHLFFLTKTSLGRSRVARGIQSVNHAAAIHYLSLGRLAISRTNQHSLSMSRVRMTLYSTPGKAHRSRRKLMLAPKLVPQPHPVHLPTLPLPIPSVLHLQRDNVVLIFFSCFTSPCFRLMCQCPVACLSLAIIRVAVLLITMSFVFDFSLVCCLIPSSMRQPPRSARKLRRKSLNNLLRDWG